MSKHLFNKSILFLVFIFIMSCKPREEFVYYQNIENISNSEKLVSYEIKIQPDDLLMIIVSAKDSESVAPFNLSVTMVANANVNAAAMAGPQAMQLYLVDSEGMINFPILGKIKVTGLSRSDLIKLLEAKISNYVTDPILNLRLMNFKISVQGEVNMPGTFTMSTERITVIEALSMAKDLTVYGRRDNILIIRDNNGVKSFNRVDITNANFINSPYYYLAQNDVVYIEPNKTKINAAAVGPNTGVIISISSLLITVVTLIATRLN